LWGIEASLEELEELRKKVRDAAKCAAPKSKAAWSNIIATRYRGWPVPLFTKLPRRDEAVKKPCGTRFWASF